MHTLSIIDNEFIVLSASHLQNHINTHTTQAQWVYDKLLSRSDRIKVNATK